MQIQEIERSVIIRFIRPEVRNPLSVDVVKSLTAALERIELDVRVTRVIITGSDGVFASGADLREIARLKSETEVREFALSGQRLMETVARMPQETIAAVNGFCYGGALDLAVACKGRIASSNAVFAHPGVGLGIITGWSGTQRLPRLIGEAAALEMFMTAAPVLAEKAKSIGLVDDVTDDPLAKALAADHLKFSK